MRQVLIGIAYALHDAHAPLILKWIEVGQPGYQGCLVGQGEIGLDTESKQALDGVFDAGADDTVVEKVLLMGDTGGTPLARADDTVVEKVLALEQLPKAGLQLEVVRQQGGRHAADDILVGLGMHEVAIDLAANVLGHLLAALGEEDIVHVVVAHGPVWPKIVLIPSS